MLNLTALKLLRKFQLPTRNYTQLPNQTAPKSHWNINAIIVCNATLDLPVAGASSCILEADKTHVVFLTNLIMGDNRKYLISNSFTFLEHMFELTKNKLLSVFIDR